MELFESFTMPPEPFPDDPHPGGPLGGPPGGLEGPDSPDGPVGPLLPGCQPPPGGPRFPGGPSPLELIGLEWVSIRSEISQMFYF